MQNYITIHNPKVDLNFYDNQSTFRMDDFFQHLTILDALTILINLRPAEN